MRIASTRICSTIFNLVALKASMPLRPTRSIFLSLCYLGSIAVLGAPAGLTCAAEASVNDNTKPVDFAVQKNNPRKHDALRHSERDRILQSIKKKHPHFKQQESLASDFTGEEPILLLLEKRPSNKKQNSPRLADAYYYDYKTNETIHCIVNPETGVIIEELRTVELQLPLVKEEIERAFTIYLQSSHRNELADAYREATGQSLIDVSSLHFKAFILHGSANMTRLNAATKRCGRSRCAKLLIHTEENIALNITPIIDLSKGQVIQGNTERSAGRAIPAVNANSPQEPVHRHEQTNGSEQHALPH